MSGRPNAEGVDWLRSVEKTIEHLGRVPSIRNPSDLMGPGLAPHAVQIIDWSGDEAAFNGFFYSEPGALSSPDPALWWIGTSMATGDGYGAQRVLTFRDDITPPLVYARTFTSPAGVRLYTAWASDRAVITAPMTGGPFSVTSGGGASPIPGTNVVLTVPSALATWEVTLDVSAQKSGSVDATLQVTLEVDGTPQTRDILLATAEGSSRHHASITWPLSGLSVGDHDLEPFAEISAGAGNWTMTQSATLLTVRRT